MKRIQTFALPFIYPSLNTILALHWVKRRRLKRTYQEVMLPLIKGHRLKPVTGKANISIFLHFKDNRRRDEDNYTPKWLLDVLVGAGILIDDDSKHVSSSVRIIRKKFHNFKSERTVVNIYARYLPGKKQLTTIRQRTLLPMPSRCGNNG